MDGMETSGDHPPPWTERQTTMLVDGGIYCQFSDYPKLDGLFFTTYQSGDQNRGATDSDYNIT